MEVHSWRENEADGRRGGGENVSHSMPQCESSISKWLEIVDRAYQKCTLSGSTRHEQMCAPMDTQWVQEEDGGKRLRAQHERIGR